MMKLIGPPVDGFVFESKSKSGHTTASGAFQSLQRHCEELGIREVGTHTLRRTFITNLARLGVPVEIRNRLTNHKDPSIDALYNQHDYLQERLEALDAWDKKLTDILNCIPTERVV
jgi:integrase